MTDTLPLHGEHIVILGDSRWDGMMHMWHQLALRWARDNANSVTYLCDIPLMTPTVSRLMSKLKERFTPLRPTSQGRLPGDSLRLIEPTFLPPMIPGATIYNRRLMLAAGSRILARRPPAIFMAFMPAQPVLDLINLLHPEVIAYASVHYYPTYDTGPETVEAEISLAKQADVIYADTAITQHHLEQATGKAVGILQGGTDYQCFRGAERGDEPSAKRVVGYFGSLTCHKHIPEHFNSLAASGYSVAIWGNVDTRARAILHPAICIHSPVPNSELPIALREVDAIVLPYRNAPINRGLFPAKLFECMATGKPVFITDIPEIAAYRAGLHIFQDAEDLLRQLGELSKDSFANLRDRQLAIASSADWEMRWRMVDTSLSAALADSRAEVQSPEFGGTS